MEFIYLGKVRDTHGIKGEIKILSDFEKKNLVFKKGFHIYLGEEKEEQIINSYRFHKIYDMITLEGIDNIDNVLKYKGKKVFIKKSDLKLDKSDYLLTDLVDCKIVSNNKDYGVVREVINNKGRILLYIEKDKYYYIPLVDEFIKEVRLDEKVIDAERVEEFYEI